MKRNRHAVLGAALTLALAAGCLNDISNLAPYAGHIGSTYRLTYDGEVECQLWAPSAPGGDYVILPYIPQLDGKRKKGIHLKQGTPLKLEAARRGKEQDYLLVTLDDPAKPGHRIQASVHARFLEGLSADDANKS